ncbi:MAG: helix-turn-helix domain-containing protein [bacterium]
MKNKNNTCPVHKTAHLLSDMWTMLIFRQLLVTPAGFCELERSLEGISPRTLTLKLKKLEAEKLIKKAKDSIYELTKKGKGLEMVIDAMRNYGKKYLES